MPTCSGDEIDCLSSAALASQHNSMTAGWRSSSTDAADTAYLAWEQAPALIHDGALPQGPRALFQTGGPSEPVSAAPLRERPQRGSSAALAALLSSSAGSASSLAEPDSWHFTGTATHSWPLETAAGAPLPCH